jgi:hypothetical protein
MDGTESNNNDQPIYKNKSKPKGQSLENNYYVSNQTINYEEPIFNNANNSECYSLNTCLASRAKKENLSETRSDVKQKDLEESIVYFSLPMQSQSDLPTLTNIYNYYQHHNQNFTNYDKSAYANYRTSNLELSNQHLLSDLNSFNNLSNTSTLIPTFFGSEHRPHIAASSAQTFYHYHQSCDLNNYTYQFLKNESVNKTYNNNAHENNENFQTNISFLETHYTSINDNDFYKKTGEFNCPNSGTKGAKNYAKEHIPCPNYSFNQYDQLCYTNEVNQDSNVDKNFEITSNLSSLYSTNSHLKENDNSSKKNLNMIKPEPLEKDKLLELENSKYNGEHEKNILKIKYEENKNIERLNSNLEVLTKSCPHSVGYSNDNNLSYSENNKTVKRFKDLFEPCIDLNQPNVTTIMQRLYEKMIKFK